MSRVLALGFFPAFYPPMSGGEQRSHYVLKAISEHHDVIALTPTYPGTRNEIVSHSERFKEFRFSKTNTYSEWHHAMRDRKLAVGGSDYAAALSLPYHDEFLSALERHWDNSDILIIQHPSVIPALRGLDPRGKRVVYLSHNCEFELACQALDGSAGEEFLKLMHQLEYRTCQMADLIAVTSDADMQKMIALYGVTPTSSF